MQEVREWIVTRQDQVANLDFGIVVKDVQDHIEPHVSFAMALESVRFDDTVRVIVITMRAREDGDIENPVPKHQRLNPATRPSGSWALRSPWSLTQGIPRALQTLALMEKPVIARVLGDTYYFSANVLWGCDMIVAQEDALLCEGHLAGPDIYITPGDGGLAFLPLFMPPTKLKEFLMLGAAWTAKEFAALGMVNYALPADLVDAKVDELVAALLLRPIGPLVHTKRAANKALIQQMNLTQDYAWVGENLDLWTLAASDWKPQTSLRPDERNFPIDDDPSD
jgi:enoyl-CoA hydratase